MSDKRPSWTIRIDGEVLATFTAMCYEAGITNKSLALERMMRYMLQPNNLQGTKLLVSREDLKYELG